MQVFVYTPPCPGRPVPPREHRSRILRDLACQEATSRILARIEDSLILDPEEHGILERAILDELRGWSQTARGEPK